MSENESIESEKIEDMVEIKLERNASKVFLRITADRKLVDSFFGSLGGYAKAAGDSGLLSLMEQMILSGQMQEEDDDECDGSGCEDGSCRC